jgi:hypothetical protein
MLIPIRRSIARSFCNGAARDRDGVIGEEVVVVEGERVASRKNMAT